MNRRYLPIASTIAAFTAWGLLPLYWKLLQSDSGPPHMLVVRVCRVPAECAKTLAARVEVVA